MLIAVVQGVNEKPGPAISRQRSRRFRARWYLRHNRRPVARREPVPIPSRDAPVPPAMEDRPRALRQAESASRPTPSISTKGRWPTVTPGKILMTGLVVFVVTALLQIWVLIWGGLALLVFGYLLFFITPRSISLEKRWRGESIEDVPDSPWDRFKQWIKG